MWQIRAAGLITEAEYVEADIEGEKWETEMSLPLDKCVGLRHCEVRRVCFSEPEWRERIVIHVCWFFLFSPAYTSHGN